MLSLSVHFVEIPVHAILIFAETDFSPRRAAPESGMMYAEVAVANGSRAARSKAGVPE